MDRWSTKDWVYLVVLVGGLAITAGGVLAKLSSVETDVQGLTEDVDGLKLSMARQEAYWELRNEFDE